MKNRLTRAFILAAILGTGVPAHAQGIEWEKLNEEVVALYQNGQYDRAIIMAKKALEMAKNAVGSNHLSVATSLNNLSLIYDAKGQYAQAEPFYKRSLAIWEKALGPDHPNVATSLENLADMYRTTNRDEEAAAMEKRAAVIRAIKR